MDISKLSSVNRVHLKNEPQKTGEASKTLTEPKKDGNKKLKLALMGLAVIGAAGAIGFAIYKGKGNSIKLSDIKFDKGKALNETGEVFSGKIKDKLQNGDTVEMVYENGILKQSTRKGAKNFTKVFEENNGEKIVKTIVGDSESSTNITKIGQEVTQEAIKAIDKRNRLDDEIANLMGTSVGMIKQRSKIIGYLKNNQVDGYLSDCDYFVVRGMELEECLSEMAQIEKKYPRTCPSPYTVDMEKTFAFYKAVKNCVNIDYFSKAEFQAHAEKLLPLNEKLETAADIETVRKIINEFLTANQ